MKTYSLELRTRVVEAMDRQRGTQQEVATLFGVSRTFIKKLLRQRRETGSLAPKPHGGGQGAKLEEAQREQVRAYMLQTRNDATVNEVHTYVTTTLRREVSRARSGGCSSASTCHGKKTLVASERDEGKRAAFRAEGTPRGRERLSFVDETSLHTALTRRYARAPRGQRAYGHVPRNHGRIFR
jgi:transposase